MTSYHHLVKGKVKHHWSEDCACQNVGLQGHFLPSEHHCSNDGGTAAPSIVCCALLAFKANAHIHYKIIRTLYLGSHPLLIIRSQTWEIIMMYTYQTHLEINMAPFMTVKQYFSEKTALNSMTVVILVDNFKNCKAQIIYPGMKRSCKALKTRAYSAFYTPSVWERYCYIRFTHFPVAHSREVIVFELLYTLLSYRIRN